jgi:hypothetical protein
VLACWTKAGAAVPPDGVTAPEAADADPTPTPFAAVTVKVYAVPFVSPVTVALVAVPLTLADCPPGDAVTVYPVMGTPPFVEGAVQLTVACAFPATAVTPVGAPGVPAGVTAFDAAEAVLVPFALVAATVNV